MDTKQIQVLTSLKAFLAANGYAEVRIDDYTATEQGNVSVAVTSGNSAFFIWFDPDDEKPYELHVYGENDLYVETFCATPRQVLLKIMTFAA